MTLFAEEICITCGCAFGVQPVFQRTCMEQGARKRFYCPNGHPMIYSEGEADKLRRERDNLKQQQARIEQERAQERARLEGVIKGERLMRESAERRVSSAKGRITKLKKRSAEGRCPCCNRVFVDLLSHMKSKHVEYENEPVDLDAPEEAGELVQ